MGSCGDFCATCNEVCIGRYTNEQLVRELCHRGSEIYEIKKGDVCEIAHERRPIRFGTGHIFNAIPRYDGPVTILVIKEG
jgi:hypothetical protein